MTDIKKGKALLALLLHAHLYITPEQLTQDWVDRIEVILDEFNQSGDIERTDYKILTIAKEICEVYNISFKPYEEIKENPFIIKLI